MELSELDKKCFERAIELAHDAGDLKNLPIGAVMRYRDDIVGEGKNAIWSPEFSLNRHAEMEALRSVAIDMWNYARDMTVYSTLEPCVMCMGAILLYGIGCIMYGSADPYGGATSVIAHLPPFFKNRFSQAKWIGPAFSEECDSLYKQIRILEGITDE